MSDLVKRLSSEVGSFKDMIALHLEAKAEIERLRNECDALSKDCTTRYERHRQAVLDDLREWARSWTGTVSWAGRLEAFHRTLDAYEKDME